MSYNFRPLNYTLLRTCAETRYCTNCSCRIGCKIRYDFYTSNFELYLQLAEIQVKSSGRVSSTSAFEITDFIREKRDREMISYPKFSYV